MIMRFLMFFMSTTVANYITYDFLVNTFEIKDIYKKNIFRVLILPFIIFTLLIIGINYIEVPIIK